MPHAVQRSTQSVRLSPVKASSSRELRQLHTVYDKTRDRYLESNLSLVVARLLESKGKPAVTKLVSLGLGSLKSVEQNRRIKQLVIFIAIAEQLRQRNPKLEIYAQDPSFTKIDEAFLQSLGVHIISTSSSTELGEAAQYLDESTIVYCPFLTLMAYQLLFATEAVATFIGDDFDALKIKWPKHSAGRTEAESLSRRFVQAFRKRAMGSDDGFWDAEDKPFPMAMYRSTAQRHSSKQPVAKLHESALCIDAVCVFVNDILNASVLQKLHAGGVRAILSRCAGYNNVDLDEAERLGLFVANVPSYSPEAVAEFALALIQTLNRNTHRAYNRVREGNFNLDGTTVCTICAKQCDVVYNYK